MMKVTGYGGFLLIGETKIPVKEWKAAEVSPIVIYYVPVLAGRPLHWWYSMLAETPRG